MMRIQIHRTAAALAGLALVGMTTSACGGSDETGSANANPNSVVTVTEPASQTHATAADTPATATEPPQSSPANQTSPETQGQPGTASSAPTAAGDQLGSPLVSRNARVGYIGHRGTVRVDVYPVVRSGATATFTVKATAVAVDSDSNGFLFLGEAFSDNDYKMGDRSGLSPDGFQLIDGKHKQAYLVGSSTPGRCLCSPARVGSETRLTKGSSVLISATFAAPPADVKTVSVLIPSIGTIANVPVK